MRQARESLFFIPTAALLMFVVLAGLSLWADAELQDALESFPLVLSPTVSGGRAIATTVAGATITVAAVVFSITALSTQMAASQYSPRAVGGFFEDPFQQAIIGLVVGTFTYSLLILAGLGDVLDDPNGTVPSLSVSLIILFGVLSAIGIIAYINHSLRRMQVDSVVRRIARAALSSIRRELSEPNDAEISQASPPQGTHVEVVAERTGWVTFIDTAALLRDLPPGTTARIDVRVGEAVSEGDHVARLWFDAGRNGPADGDGADALPATVRDSIQLAPQRSISTDATFGVRQLVDIALRALSPGVNDPTTAVDVLHHLKIPIREVLLSDAPRRVFSGSDDQRVYMSETLSRTDYVHLAFSEIRLAAGNQLSVIEALIDVLEDLRTELEHADLTGRVVAVEEELRLTIDMARRSGLPDADLKRVMGEELEATVDFDGSSGGEGEP